MAESSISITEGSGKDLQTYARSVASTTRENQYVLPGESGLPTYTAFATMRANVANSHLMIIQGDGTNYARLRRLTIKQANIATASTMEIKVFRTSTEGTGGTAVTPRSIGLGDAVYGGTVATLPTTKGTEGAQLLQFRIGLAAANPVTRENMGEWIQQPNAKPVQFGTGPDNGIAIKNIGTSATEFDIEAEFTLTPWL